MADRAHEWTDEQIEALRVRMHQAYAQAANEMQDKLEAWLEDFDRKNKAWKRAVDVGVKTEEEYKAWIHDRAMERTWQEDMINTLTYDAVNVDVRVRQLINDEVATVYAENANYATYSIERQAGLDTAFTLYNQDSVRWLIEQDRQLFPEIDIERDMAWHRQKFTAAVTQSILQGESIPQAAARMSLIVKMDERAAERAARTAITYAESSGRQRSFERAESIGIPLKKRWHAHIDGRTRLAHREADGQTVGVHEKFNVDGYMMTGPGDPTAPGYLVYGCRCNQVGDVDRDDIPPAVVHRYSKLPKNVSYEDWKAGRYVTDRFNEETDESKKERGVE